MGRHGQREEAERTYNIARLSEQRKRHPLALVYRIRDIEPYLEVDGAVVELPCKVLYHGRC